MVDKISTQETKDRVEWSSEGRHTKQSREIVDAHMRKGLIRKQNWRMICHETINKNMSHRESSWMVF
jgi:hypothetical protein